MELDKDHINKTDNQIIWTNQAFTKLTSLHHVI